MLLDRHRRDFPVFVFDVLLRIKTVPLPLLVPFHEPTCQTCKASSKLKTFAIEQLERFSLLHPKVRALKYFGDEMKGKRAQSSRCENALRLLAMHFSTIRNLSTEDTSYANPDQSQFMKYVNRRCTRCCWIAPCTCRRPNLQFQFSFKFKCHVNRCNS